MDTGTYLISKIETYKKEINSKNSTYKKGRLIKATPVV